MSRSIQKVEESMWKEKKKKDVEGSAHDFYLVSYWIAMWSKCLRF